MNNSSTLGKKDGRIHSVDLFRLIAIIAVIIIHTIPLKVSGENGSQLDYYSRLFVNQMARFAVPFFFVISGYFWGKKVRNVSSLIKPSLLMIKRVGALFIFWCLFYILPFNVSAFCEFGFTGPLKVSYWNLLSLYNSPFVSLFVGTMDHLWFFMGLICALLVSALFIHLRLTYVLIVISILLFLFDLLATVYSHTPIGISVAYNTRNGPFFSTLPFVSGYLLSAVESSENWFYSGIFLFLFGGLYHFIELFFLWRYYNICEITGHGVGTYFMGMGIAVLSLSNHPLIKGRRLSQLGKYTLGIYGIHMFFVINLREFDKLFSLKIWEIGHVLIVLICSILAVWLMSKFFITRRFIM